MPEYNSAMNDVNGIHASTILRTLYELILRTDGSEDNAARHLIRSTIKRHHRAELKAFARIFQTGNKVFQRDALSTIRAVLIKPVNDACNLRCTYCYEGEEGTRSMGKSMTDSGMERVIVEILASPRRDIQFLWHGGEPLLAGLDFYRRAIEVQRANNPFNTEIYNAIQTNGTLLSQEWIDFFRQNNFGISLSIDGSKSLHDASRIDPRAKGTHSSVIAAVKLLQKNAIAFNVISVVGPGHAGRDRDYWSFIREQGITSFDLHPSNGTGTSGPKAVSPKVFSDFVNAVFDHWLAEGDSTVRIGLIDDFFRLLSGNPPQTCYHAGGCSDIIAVEGNGRVIPCTRPFDGSQYTFGNTDDASLLDIVASERFKSFRERDIASQLGSIGCRWYEICHNGCPQQRTTAGQQDVGGQGYYCQCRTGVQGGYFEIWEHAYGRVQDLFSRGATSELAKD
ncbi:radical SAM protein [Paraburkholderia sp. MM6662-R1]|uniref:radical SAM protein n=1 Tax=Paraburkholderia sp. MM6662-R1 TaxID=2991066 RepID=UPI003D1F4747